MDRESSYTSLELMTIIRSGEIYLFWCTNSALFRICQMVICNNIIYTDKAKVLKLKYGYITDQEIQDDRIQESSRMTWQLPISRRRQQKKNEYFVVLTGSIYRHATNRVGCQAGTTTLGKLRPDLHCRQLPRDLHPAGERLPRGQAGPTLHGGVFWSRWDSRAVHLPCHDNERV